MFWTRNTPLSYVPKRVQDALARTFEPNEIAELSKLATLVDLTAGDKIAIEGTTGQQAVVIVSGTATVTRHGDFVATVGNGDIVGEMSLLSGEPRIATVVADSDMTVYALSTRDFASLLARCPKLEARITAGALRRLSAAV